MSPTTRGGPGREPSRRTGDRRPRAARPRGGASERDLVDWLRREAGESGHLIGDDAAVLALGDGWAFTVDSQIEGTHFPPGLDPTVVARRLLLVNLSDVAAMGTTASFALLALSAPAGFDHRRFLRAFLAAAREHGVYLIGGDVARAPVLTASLTLLAPRRVGGHWLRRELAQPGDTLWVGGSLGQSALGRLLLARGARVRASPLGNVAPRQVRLPAAPALHPRERTAARLAVLRHLAPRPQLHLAVELARRRRCACIDVSDGLALDLARLSTASGTGATVDAEALPLAAGAEGLARALGADAHELALGGGEDYVLLFALPPRVAAPAGCTRIGTVEAQRGLRLRRDGRVEPLAPRGWDHLRDGAPGDRAPRRQRPRK